MRTYVVNTYERNLKMRIRDLTLEDFDTVNNLFMQLHNLHVAHRPDIFKEIEKPTTPEAWGFEASLGDENKILLGAELDGEIVGLCFVIMRKPKNEVLVPRICAFIDDIVVDENHRENGIGTALYNEAVRRAKLYGAVSVELGVSIFNTAALDFYKSLGMTVQSYKMEKSI